MAFDIYCYTHSVNQKRYVGLTKQGIARRNYQHTADAKRGAKTHFHSAIRKYGIDAFVLEILETVDTIESANEAEIWWIAHFGSDDKALGYNLDAGGTSKNTHPDTRARQSVSQKRRFEDPEERAKTGASSIGRIASSATCAARSASLKSHYSDTTHLAAGRARAASLRIPEIEARRVAGLKAFYAVNTPPASLQAAKAAAKSMYAARSAERTASFDGSCIHCKCPKLKIHGKRNGQTAFKCKECRKTFWLVLKTNLESYVSV